MDKRELERFIWQEEKRIEKARSQRSLKLIAFLSICYFVVLCWINEPHGLELLATIVLSPICGVCHLLINSTIFYPVFSKNTAEDNYIKELKKKLNQ